MSAGNTSENIPSCWGGSKYTGTGGFLKRQERVEKQWVGTVGEGRVKIITNKAFLRSK